MNYNNVLLINSNYIKLKYKGSLYKLELPKNILQNGVIVNYDDFALKYIEFIKKNRIIKLSWNKNLIIICNSLNKTYNKDKIYYMFKDMNYHKVKVLSENNLFKINKNNNYLVMDNILRLYYIDKYNMKKILYLDTNLFYPHEIKQLIANRSKKKTLYIIGKINQKYIAKDLDYYYFENIDEFFLNYSIQ